jgi:hypothetical protein
MADWPNTLLPPFSVITPWSLESMGAGGFTKTTTPVASGVYTQNAAYFYPFRLEVPAVAVKMFLQNGATQNGNVDLGIYDAAFNYKISIGSTAQGVANSFQEFDITDTLLAPGIWWMAFAGNSATGTTFRMANDDSVGPALAPHLFQTSAFALPTSTVTPVKSTEAAPLVHVMGVAFDSVI